MGDIVSPDSEVGPNLWLKAAQASVRSYCGWHIAPNVEQTLTLDAEGGRTLMLPSLHVTGLSRITVDGRDVTGEVDWSQTGMVSLRSGSFPDRFRSVIVTMSSGYEVDEVPDVVSIILKLANRAATGPGVVASQSVNGSSVSYLTAGGAPLSTPLLQIEKDALEPYRLKWTA
ncbi:hypothetical protein AB656_03985 [Bifidobacterium actinocoloniiforme DSM 22766]|nr:hypothetical protein AB656_03985 [Bifidobacterium actinocoloniiforme DSM 22766]